MSDRASEQETVVEFPATGDPLDKTGRGIMGSLDRAATLLRENIQNTVNVSHKLSLQLGEAQERIRELEAHVRHHKDRADRAEQWLHHIAQEIEQRFFSSVRADQTPTRQNGPRRG
jgi:hypothetical protein